MKKVLWLAGWYPNQIEPLTGDFIERHAKAVSLKHDVSVLHVYKDYLNATPGKKYVEERFYNERCHATIIYYKVGFRKLKSLHTLLSTWYFIRYNLSAFRDHISKKGKPDFLHVHVAMKAGLVALVIKMLYKIPYVITEHWSAFCPEAKPNFTNQPFISQWIWRQVMKNASGYTTVSGYLGEAIQKLSGGLPYIVIPNVVDTDLCKPIAGYFHEKAFRFIHVSTLNYQKNPELLLEETSRLSLQKAHFELIIFGPVTPGLINMIKQLKLESIVRFKGEVSQPELIQEMQTCDALILCSRYETFGCVIIEANACGLPVIVSDHPVFHENVLHGITGIFVTPDKPGELAEKMRWMIDNKQHFSAENIAAITEQTYSYTAVAARFDAFYKNVLEINPG